MAKKKQNREGSGLLLVEGAPKVVLLGRPNVGKSTLFNRLIRSNRAITHDRPGVTRDRMEGWVKRKGLDPFIIVDTGGITMDAHASAAPGPAGLRGFEEEILNQARMAVREASVLVLVVDARDGLTPFDSHLADFLRRAGLPLLLVVNKVDGPEKADLLCAEFHGLGFELLPCSAEHGFNIQALVDTLDEMLPERPGYDDLAEESSWLAEDAAAPKGRAGKARATGSGEGADDSGLEAGPEGSAEDGLEDAPEGGPDSATGAPADSAGGPSGASSGEHAEERTGPLRIALLGRPNVGKSSLVNALTRQERVIVSPVAGTTRDSIDVPVLIDGEPCIFVDSAGVRRKAKITDSVERFSVNSALKTSTKAEITLLVLDGQEGLTVQDKRLLELLDERKLPFIVLVNKADLMKPAEVLAIEKTYKEELGYCRHIPLLMVSAFTRRNLKKILPLAKSILEESRLRVGTGQLNRILEQLVEARQPPLVKRKRAKFYYMTQAETSPPTFVFFVSDVERVPESYSRYLERSLRKILGLKHAPIRVRFRAR